MPFERLLRGSALQAVLYQGKRVAAQPDAIDLQILKHALNIVARLVEGDRLDPIDDVDRLGPGIAEIVDPLPDAAGTGVVGGDRQNVGPGEAVEEVIDIGTAELQVVAAVGEQAIG